MSAEENKALIRRLVDEVYNDNDLDVLDKLVAQDIINHSAVPEHQHGIEGFRHVNEWVRAAFSDVHYEIEDMIAEGDMVACRITVSGTQDGEFRGNPRQNATKAGLSIPECGPKGLEGVFQQALSSQKPIRFPRLLPIVYTLGHGR
jgi:predicted ester cyclase